MTKHFYLNRDKKFSEVELISETPFKRVIKFLEGDNANKTKNIHPQGVAWGNMYPRLFTASQKPQHTFVHKGRALVQCSESDDNPAIPTEESYRFQPFVCDVIDSINSKENVLLTGGTGVGKTTHILQMAARIKQPVLRINFNGETRMSDLIGKVSVVNGETVWVDGVIPTSMRKGYWLLLDELDFADPAVLSLLHPVLEEDALLVLKENAGEIIRPHANWRIFATANSIGAMQDRAEAYDGTNKMNEAFLDRWQVVMVDNLPEKEEIQVIKSKVRGLAHATVRKIVQFANKVRNQEVEFSGDNFSTRKVLAWSKKTALHRNALVGAKLAWLDKLPASEKDVVVRLLTTHFGSRRQGKPKLKVNSSTAFGNTVKKRGRKPKQLLNGTSGGVL